MARSPKFKDYILPLIFVKRLSDVFDDELDRLAEKFGDRETALGSTKAEHPGQVGADDLAQPERRPRDRWLSP